MPFPQTQLLMSTDQPFDTSQLMSRESQVVRKPNGLEPHFGRHILTGDMNMRRLTSIMTGEVDLVGTFDAHTRHARQHSEVAASAAIAFRPGSMPGFPITLAARTPMT